MSYSCPDCEAALVPRIRQLVLDPEAVIELVAGETIYGIKGQAFVVSVECSNGCSGESDETPPPPGDDLQCRRLQENGASPPQQKTQGGR